MIMSEEIVCYHCNKAFYLHSYRLREAKTVSCLFCGRRINKDLAQKGKKVDFRYIFGGLDDKMGEETNKLTEGLIHLKDKSGLTYIRPLEALFIFDLLHILLFVSIPLQQWDQLVKMLVIDTTNTKKTEE